MVLPDLESAFGGMLEMIAKKGGSDVELSLGSVPQQLRISREIGGGKALETFMALYDPRLSNMPVVSYVLSGESPLPPFIIPDVAVVAGLLNGTRPTVSDSTAFGYFIGAINAEAAKANGVIGCQRSCHPNRIPYFVARFAVRMIPGLTG